MNALRILCLLSLPSGAIRVWDGSGGPFVDGDGNIWRAAQFTSEALQSIEAAINAEAYTLTVSLISVSQSVADSIWEYDATTDIRGSVFQILLQEVDSYSQPVGAASVSFTGEIDNLMVTDNAVDEDGGGYIKSVVTIEVTNRFTLRNTTFGAVLSDVDQKARSKILNPTGNADRACERVTEYRDKKIRWPSW